MKTISFMVCSFRLSASKRTSILIFLAAWPGTCRRSWLSVLKYWKNKLWRRSKMLPPPIAPAQHQPARTSCCSVAPVNCAISSLRLPLIWAVWGLPSVCADLAVSPEGEGRAGLEAVGVFHAIWLENNNPHLVCSEAPISVPSNVSQPPGEVFYHSGLLVNISLLYDLPSVKNKWFHVSAWFTLTNTASSCEAFKRWVKFSSLLEIAMMIIMEGLIIKGIACLIKIKPVFEHSGAQKTFEIK